MGRVSPPGYVGRMDSALLNDGESRRKSLLLVNTAGGDIAWEIPEEYRAGRKTFEETRVGRKMPTLYHIPAL